MNTENNKTDEPHWFRLTLADKHNLKIDDEHHIVMPEYNLTEYIKNYSKNLVLYGIKQEIFHLIL